MVKDRQLTINRWLLAALCALLLATGTAKAARAHGTDISYTISEQTITVVALFDDATPMADATYTIYAPDNPQEAYLAGVADGNGIFEFDIDTRIDGRWDVTISSGGHGDIVRIPVERGTIGEYQPERFPQWVRMVAGLGVIALLGGGYMLLGRRN